MPDFLSWIAVALSIGGNLLVARRRVEGFYLWLVANLIWIAVFIEGGSTAAAVLFVVYLVLALYGIWEWTRHKRKERLGHIEI